MSLRMFGLATNFVATLLIAPCFAQSGPDVTICTTLFSQGINDVHQVYSDQEHFERYKSILKSLNIQTYSDLEKSSASVGLSIPTLDDLIGFDASEANDSQKFQQVYKDFLNSTWDQVQSRLVNFDMKSQINSALLDTYKDCERNYFSASLATLRQIVTIIPQNPPDSFLMRIAAWFPPGADNPTIRVTAVEPSPEVRCSSNGHTISFPFTFSSAEALLTCTKPVDKAVAVLVRTNAGVPDESTDIPAARNKTDDLNERISALEAKMEAMSLSQEPVGAIAPYGGDLEHNPTAQQALAKAGWLPCDGRSLSSTDPNYVGLFNAIANVYGGHGPTFNLPDLRGYFLRGTDSNAGRDPGHDSRTAMAPGGNAGNQVGSVEADEVGPHGHTITDPGHAHDLAHGYLYDQSGGYGHGGGGGGGDYHDPPTKPLPVIANMTGITVNQSAGVETRPKNVNVNYIIRYR